MLGIQLTCLGGFQKLFHVYMALLKVRSSHRRCSVKKSVLRNFVKFTGKHLCQRLFFNKAVGLRPATLLKRSLWHRCFLVNFAKVLRTPFLQNAAGRLPLSKYQLKKATKKNPINSCIPQVTKFEWEIWIIYFQ